MNQKQFKRRPSLAIYPGSFDPITYGHLDIVARAGRLFDRIIIAVSHASVKQPMFSVEDRMDLIRESLRESNLNKGIEVDSFQGLLADYAKKKSCFVVIRGIRFISDFEYELQMALTNRHLYPDMETVYLMPDEKHIYLSSTIVKEIAGLGQTPAKFVPRCVARALRSLRAVI
ncbi:MAG: pantetheine-phosphate adenylyltransferase [Elusimicrobiota bacterium]